MNALILSALTVALALFHLAVRACMRRGHVGAGFCAIWCIDAVFAVCGAAISFYLYRYLFRPWLTARNLAMAVVYLALTVLLIALAPSGFSLFRRKLFQGKSFPGKEECGEEETALAEYRLNETLCMVRNVFLALLFVLPVLFAVAERSGGRFSLPAAWREGDVCGGFCFVAFLILVPVSLRQALFWFRNLTGWSGQAGEALQERYRAGLMYRHKNRAI